MKSRIVVSATILSLWLGSLIWMWQLLEAQHQPCAENLVSSAWARLPLLLDAELNAHTNTHAEQRTNRNRGNDASNCIDKKRENADSDSIRILKSWFDPSNQEEEQYWFDENDGFVIVTAASENFYDRLENLVGSVHTHRPQTRILVYDLNLSPEQKSHIKRWCNTELRSLDWDSLPSHMKELGNFAWKVEVIHDALKSHKAILWQDSGQEVRSGLVELERVLRMEGYFLVVNLPWRSCQMTSRKTYHHLNISDWERIRQCNRPQCGASTLGFVAHHPIIKEIVSQARTCAHNINCIAPNGTTSRNHRFDQSVWTALSLQYELYFHPNPAYWLDPRQIPDGNEEDAILNRLAVVGDLALFSRKSIQKKPFKDKIQLCAEK